MKDERYLEHINKGTTKAVENLWFQGATLHGKDYRNYFPFDREDFCRTLKESVESGLLECNKMLIWQCWD
jgi:hypothetical protein